MVFISFSIYEILCQDTNCWHVVVRLTQHHPSRGIHRHLWTIKLIRATGRLGSAPADVAAVKAPLDGPFLISPSFRQSHLPTTGGIDVLETY